MRGVGPMLVLLLILLGSFVIVGGDAFTPPRNSVQGQFIEAPAQERNNNLQVNTIDFITVTPTQPPAAPQTPLPPPSGPACNHDNGLPALNTGSHIQENTPACYCPAFLVKCEEKRCVEILNKPVGCKEIISGPIGADLPDQWCRTPHLAGDGTGVFCIGKPVIYLYPLHPMFVNVSVKTPGEIVVSDPLYPSGGWKNVLAFPNGKLLYKEKTYHELFYESELSHVARPTTGFNIPSEELESKLDQYITQLGLIGPEKKEFLDFWIPRLNALNAPYIFFSLVEENEKERIDHLTITPQPDTMIEFIAYFKPLQTPYKGNPLVLPSLPERHGFTAVEWGGTIEY